MKRMAGLILHAPEVNDLLERGQIMIVRAPKELQRLPDPLQRYRVKETWTQLLAVSPATCEPLKIGPGEKLIDPPTKHKGRWNYDGLVIAYAANSDIEFCDGDGFSGDMANRDEMARWKAATTMPEWASRLFVEVVRFQPVFGGSPRWEMTIRTIPDPNVELRIKVSKLQGYKRALQAIRADHEGDLDEIEDRLMLNPGLDIIEEEREAMQERITALDLSIRRMTQVLNHLAKPHVCSFSTRCQRCKAEQELTADLTLDKS